jgi:hypothetical protein
MFPGENGHPAIDQPFIGSRSKVTVVCVHRRLEFSRR